MLQVVTGRHDSSRRAMQCFKNFAAGLYRTAAMIEAQRAKPPKFLSPPGAPWATVK